MEIDDACIIYPVERSAVSGDDEGLTVGLMLAFAHGSTLTLAS